MQKVYFLSNLPTRLQWQEEIHWLVGMLLLQGLLGMTVISNGTEYGNSTYLTNSKCLCGVLLITVYWYKKIEQGAELSLTRGVLSVQGLMRIADISF